MKAIVCGAGIAGLAAATAIARGGWEVLVVERAPAIRDAGYVIDFFGPGYDAAERMGLLPALERVRYQVERARWIDDSGRTTVSIRYDRFARILGGRLMSLMRGDIERTLFDALPASVEMRFGRTVEAFEDRGDHVRVDLGSGMSERADVLVGADGIHSRVRVLAFGSESSFVRDLGYRTAAFLFDDARIHEALGSQVVLLAVPDRQAGLYPLRDGRVASFFVHRDREPLPSSPVETLRRVYGDLGWFIPDALAAAARASSIYFDVVAQAVMPRWRQGRVVLVGDACQAVSLLAGQGASIAMAAGEALGRELTGGGSVDEALARYESRLRPIVERRQAAGRRMARWFAPSSRAGIAIRDATLRMIEFPGVEALLRTLFLASRR
jgi:2-polyprenyl-6-methoxyphenol hydroxylase-like FAD-dependent oxidoreductase